MGGRALLVDLYELTMAQSYLDERLDDRPATFSMYARHLPGGWRYFVAAGLDEALRALEELRFADDDLAYLESTDLFTAPLLERLGRLRFSGEVRALPEGTLFFPDEPLLEVTGPVLEAQLLETVLLNVVHLHSLLASKAARSVDVAQGRLLVEFGLRREHGGDAGLAAARSSYLAGFDSTSNVLAGKLYGIPIAGTMAHSFVEAFADELEHGGDAGLAAARSSYLAGFDSTSNVLAGKLYGIPIAGTMAHSFVEAFADELEAFRAFARAYPDRCTLLVDTYDTVEGARRAAVVARELAEQGHRLHGVRLDSGDLVELSRRVRAVLDEAGFPDAMVFASGNLDEEEIERLLAAGAPIGGFGVGSRLGTSADAPYLDLAYKLVAFDGRPVLKLSQGKATWPGAKQVFRVEEGGRFSHDVIGLADEPPPAGARPLLETVMSGGRRLVRGTLAEARERCAAERRSLPARPYEVRFSPALGDLREQVAADARRRHGL